MSRLGLRIKAAFFRALQSIVTFLDLYFSHPLPLRPAFTRSVPSSVGSTPGVFDILFYVPASAGDASAAPAKGKLPLLVNFHGGGFTIGNAGDDARWATAVIERAPAVVASVDYRRAPEHPFPVGIEDCVSAVLWLWQHADELGVDISRTALSGFSAGGNLTYAVAIRLQEELQKDAKRAPPGGKIVGIASFYGSADWTQSRAERDASNPNLIPVIPKPLFKLFDESYLYPLPDMTSPLLSPGRAPDELLRDAFPDQLVMVECSGDQLLAEGLRFKERLQALGKRVDSYTAEGVGHAWDKQPSFKKGNAKRDEAYKLATESLHSFWGA